MSDIRLIDANVVYGKILFRHNVSVITSSKEAYARCLDIVKNAPTVDTVPVKRGKWKRNASGELECSNCMYNPKWDDDKFCAGCGARMDGDSE